MSEMQVTSFERAIAQGAAKVPAEAEVKTSARGNQYLTYKVWIVLGTERFLVTYNAVHSAKTSGIPAGASPEQRRALLALKALRESGQSLENVD